MITARFDNFLELDSALEGTTPSTFDFGEGLQ